VVCVCVWVFFFFRGGCLCQPSIMALKDTWTLDLPVLDLQLNSGDVGAIVELVLADVLATSTCALLGFTAHASYTRASGHPVLRKALALAVGMAAASVPFVLSAPFQPLRTRAAGFILSCHAVFATFRWVELVVGRGPKGAAASAGTFALYFSFNSEICFEDGKVKRLTRRRSECLSLLLDLVLHGLLLFILNSIGRATGFTPLLPGSDFLSSFPTFGLPASYVALYLLAFVTYSMLSLGILAHRLLLAAFGVETVVAMKAPLLLSSSLREFWGRRWNLLIHGLMKRCFFEPFRDGSARERQLGATLAFLMSGLFHEYMWLVVNLVRPDSSQYVFGKVLVFFLIQFPLTAFETVATKTPLGRMAASLPGPVLTVLVTLAVLPASPFFFEGIFDMLRELAYWMPTAEVKGAAGMGLRSAILCLLSVLAAGMSRQKLEEKASKQAEDVRHARRDLHVRETRAPAES